MDPLLREIATLAREGRPFSLGTVVHTAGSTPQKAGARAVFLPDGRILGTLGGGCMEAEARRRGIQLLQHGEPELLELHLDDDFGWDDGLICGGTASIFLQPRSHVSAEPYEAAVALHEVRGRGVLAVVVSANDAALVGQGCLVRQAEASVGSLDGGSVLSAVEEAGRMILLEGREEPRRVRLGESGVVVYAEPILPRPVLFIAGAGHIGGALCHYGARIGFEVVVVDDRPSFANTERLPAADRVIADDVVKTVRDWPKTPDTYFVIVTRGHRNDAVVLREVIGAPLAYVGMIGSRRKVLTIFDEFLEQGLATAEQLLRIHAPIGLDIGAISVDEIALSIAAELILARRKGTADGDGDRAGGGRVAADGTAQTVASLRAADRDRDGRPLASSLPVRRRSRGHRPCQGGT